VDVFQVGSWQALSGEKMNSDNQKIFTLGRVRNVSESEIVAMSTKETLIQLLTLLDAILEYKSNKERYGDLAGRLSKIANKEPAWGWRYVQSVVSGTVEPSKKFSNAVDVLAVSFDGIPVPFAKSSPVTVYAETGTIQEGAFVMLPSQVCANPACTVTFVPNVPWRKLCPVCSPKK